ncbi:MAG: redoxin domain-containing protein [Actinomycetota bacterium]|nr:redoxin domain-containing protein [Actinomycetota bacterium]
MSNKIVWLVIAAGVVVMVVGVALAGTLGSDPTVVGSALIDKPAPEMVLDELEGDGQVRLSDHLGDVVVINFWASWCTGCRQEHSALDSAASDYANFDVTFFSVNTQDQEDLAIGFLDRFGRSAETVYGIDHGSNAAFSYGVAGLPETFFVDRGGIVVGKVIGPVTYDLLTATIDRVLLGEDIGSVKTGETEQG